MRGGRSIGRAVTNMVAGLSETVAKQSVAGMGGKDKHSSRNSQTNCGWRVHLPWRAIVQGVLVSAHTRDTHRRTRTHTHARARAHTHTAATVSSPSSTKPVAILQPER